MIYKKTRCQKVRKKQGPIRFDDLPIHGKDSETIVREIDRAREINNVRASFFPMEEREPYDSANKELFQKRHIFNSFLGLQKAIIEQLTGID